MKSKKQQLHENIMLAIIAVPLLGILLGGIYTYPAMKITKERDPIFTSLLGLCLGITIFSIGLPSHAQISHLLIAWSVSLVLLLLARAAFGSLGHSFERFGIVHLATLFISLLVLLAEKRLKH